MRHIPEDELHAYLDQALSRSQCVEIERHLARCDGCQSERDAIAALRDRTTELVARLGPPPIIPPPFEVLRARREARLLLRRQWLSRVTWAAGIVGAMASGWQVNRLVRPDPHAIVVTPAPRPRSDISWFSPSLAPAAFGVPAAPLPTPERTTPPSRQLVRVAPVPGPVPSVRFAREVELAAPVSLRDRFGESATLASEPLAVPDLMAQPVRGDLGLQGLWRTILPDTAEPPPIADIARVPGLPVVQMRVQPGTGGADVTAVDQLLGSGEVIRTIAGPAGRVGPLLETEPAGTVVPREDQSNARMTVTIRQGDRMVAVTGPSQALGSLLSRVNLKRRRY